MKKLTVLLVFACCFILSATAQKKSHKIVFEITSADTSDHITMLRQINNVMKDVPGTPQVEVVCHGPAIFMLVSSKTVVAAAMQDLKTKYNVVFAACNNSMKKNNIEVSQLVPVATVVPNGVMEVVTKEEDGWSYIKAGH